MAANGGFGSFRHLALRFFGVLDPRGPSATEEAWALGWLLPGEQELWRRMSGPDRRHAAGVARDAARLLGYGGGAGEAEGAGGGGGGAGAGYGGGSDGAGAGGGGAMPVREVMASALLHDVGKVESGLGTFARVGVTVAAIGFGRERLMRGAREGGPGGRRGPGGGRRGDGRDSGWRRRAGDYLGHDRIGADLLREAGSDPMTVMWAAEHHLPADQWSVERRVADALKAADGD